jgi:hypothetical protein
LDKLQTQQKKFKNPALHLVLAAGELKELGFFFEKR